MRNKKKTHKLRNTFLLLILFMFIGGCAYGAAQYRSLKNSVNSSFKPSGISKARDTSKQIKSKKPLSILLLGTDTGALGRDYQGRTDSMMIITLNPQTKKTTITSIPRDTAVHVPGFAKKMPTKINSAYSLGQTKTSIETVQKMLNVPIDYYALINMGGMEKVIDQAGGIDIKPRLSFDYEGYSFDKNKLTHMNGKKALAYSRMRYDDPQGDYGRQSRQREVFKAIISKSSSVSTLLNQAFVKSLADQVQTDLTFDNLTTLAKNYNSTRKHTDETHLQGKGQTIDGHSMEVVSKSELQRVTDFVRANLDLSKAKTGDIEYEKSDTTTTKTTTNQYSRY